jgi:membrane-bound metal-dependent hydrolase YbcI (DUF457 family)
MLPFAHIAYTWLATSLAQEHLDLPEAEQIDYRLIAVAATAPDLVDKPLAAAYFYRRHRSAVLFAHTLIANIAVVALAARAVKRGRSSLLWVYTAAVLGHALLDRLWHYPDTLYWPFRGWRFHVWGKRGSEQEKIGWAYWVAFTRRPELWGWEVGGLLSLALFVWRHRLYRFEQLRDFVITGRVQRRG